MRYWLRTHSKYRRCFSASPIELISRLLLGACLYWCASFPVILVIDHLWWCSCLSKILPNCWRRFSGVQFIVGMGSSFFAFMEYSSYLSLLILRFPVLSISSSACRKDVLSLSYKGSIGLPSKSSGMLHYLVPFGSGPDGSHVNHTYGGSIYWNSLKQCPASTVFC